jgi:hypothetical protein
VTLRRDGKFATVICDGCEMRHKTREKNLILGFYDAILEAGWRAGDDFQPSRPGIFCPRCIEGAPSEEHR